MNDERLPVGDHSATRPAGTSRPAPPEVGDAPVAHAPAVEAAAEDTPEADDPARLAAERDEYLEALQRVQAEFENYRKRALRERDAADDRAVAAVIDRLLPVFDAIDAARDHHPDALAPINSVLHPALISLGVERIDPLGEPFDPEAHEAVAVDIDDEQTAGGDAVIEVLRSGYRCRGRLLRPAMVRVGEEQP